MNKFEKFGQSTGKFVGKSLDYIVTKIDDAKEKIDPSLDKGMFIAETNLVALYGAVSFIDAHDFSEPTNGLIMLASGAALTVGNYSLFVSDKTRALRTKIKEKNNSINNYRLASWVKTLGLGVAIFFTSQKLNPYAEQIVDDFSKKDIAVVDINNSVDNSKKYESSIYFTNMLTLISKSLEKILKIPEKRYYVKIPFIESKKVFLRPKIYDSLGYTPLVDNTFPSANLADKNSIVGRIQRTLRWEPIFREVEKKHKMPKYTLAGMIMLESYGDPVQPNETGDGGFGLVHVQGTTGQAYGLEIYGSSNKDSDKNHGKQIQELLIKTHYDLVEIQKYDDRAHIKKVLDVAARIVTEGKNIYGTWTSGVEYFRNPNKVGKNLTWKYQDKVNKFRKYIQNQKLIQEARLDFEKRNVGQLFDEYIKKHQEMNVNWDLDKYILAKL